MSKHIIGSILICVVFILNISAQTPYTKIGVFDMFSDIGAPEIAGTARSEERRVGKECLCWCRSRWSPYH